MTYAASFNQTSIQAYKSVDYIQKHNMKPTKKKKSYCHVVNIKKPKNVSGKNNRASSFRKDRLSPVSV